jgi:hypothetical protein
MVILHCRAVTTVIVTERCSVNVLVRLLTVTNLTITRGGLFDL